MALEANNIRDCRDEAESKFPDMVESARDILNAFEFSLLEVLHHSAGRAREHHSKTQDKIDKRMTEIDFDGGH